MVDHVSVPGFHSSASYTGLVTSLNPGPLLPLVTSTCPSARSVAFICRRANCMEGTLRHTGDAWLRSITSAELVGGSPPPAYRIFPGAYITAEPSTRSATFRSSTGVQAPVPVTSRYREVGGKPARNTLPFGATNIAG
jgi:hypothetical protein